MLSACFAPTLLHFLYTDELELDLVTNFLNNRKRERRSPSEAADGDLDEFDELLDCNPPADDSSRSVQFACQLYEIAKMLEIEPLAVACEDFIVENATVENVNLIIDWSSSGLGSPWVTRVLLAVVCKVRDD